MNVRSTLPQAEVGNPPPRPSPARGEGALTPGEAVPAGSIDAALSPRGSRAALRRRLIVYALRVAFAVLWIGSWELSSRLNWVDPFFVGQPSGVVSRLWTWITEGTALGPPWLQAAVTMEEAVLGFVIGSALGVVLGILLGRIQLLSEGLSPFMHAAKAIPRVLLCFP